MIRFVKRHALRFIILTYFILLIIAGIAEDAELQVVVFTFFFTILIVTPWLIWQIRSLLRLKNEKSKTELLHLQSQVNPHFFFNTLNNLYGLIETDPKKAGKLVLKLSDMMRYSIYEGEKETVTIKEEIDYLKNYIELHKMRYRKKIDVQFDHHIIDESLKVMPLLFILLLENAFKHGVENLREKAYVKIYLSTSDSEIHFTIENNFDKEALSEEKGIGIKNLKRRLELAYPRRHSLSISSSGDIYKAQLTLKK
ncbi:sensor histidine kinase [Ekhidna sp.]